jgi:hypothetical protein
MAREGEDVRPTPKVPERLFAYQKTHLTGSRRQADLEHVGDILQRMSSGGGIADAAEANMVLVVLRRHLTRLKHDSGERAASFYKKSPLGTHDYSRAQDGIKAVQALIREIKTKFGIGKP